MKKIKKIAAVFSLCLLLIMAGIGNISVSSLELDSEGYNRDDFSLYIYTEEIPESATNYAEKYFSGFTETFLFDLGFKYEEVHNLKLLPGMTAYEYDECDSKTYYFPVINNEESVAMLTVIDHENDIYSAQFGKSLMSDTLNSLSTDYDNPIALVITNEAMYAIDKNNNFTTVDKYWAYDSKENKESKFSSTNYKVNVLYSDVKFDNGKVVEISENKLIKEKKYTNSYTNYLKGTKDLPPNYALMTPFVGNYPTDEYPGGVCWACAAASIVKYRLGTSINKTADEICGEIVDAGYTVTTDVLTDNMKTAMQGYLGSSMTKTGVMSFSSLRSQIYGNKPIFTNWPRSGGGHCLVLRSYVVGSTGINSIGFMDCNHTTYYTAMTYGTSFTNGTYNYTWQDSAY